MLGVFDLQLYIDGLLLLGDCNIDVTKDNRFITKN